MVLYAWIMTTIFSSAFVLLFHSWWTLYDLPCVCPHWFCFKILKSLPFTSYPWSSILPMSLLLAIASSVSTLIYGTPYPLMAYIIHIGILWAGWKNNKNFLPKEVVLLCKPFLFTLWMWHTWIKKIKIDFWLFRLKMPKVMKRLYKGLQIQLLVHLFTVWWLCLWQRLPFGMHCLLCTSWSNDTSALLLFCTCGSCMLGCRNQCECYAWWTTIPLRAIFALHLFLWTYE